MLGHVAGVPIEEMVSYVAMSSAGTIVAIRVWFGRWFPRVTRSASQDLEPCDHTRFEQASDGRVEVVEAIDDVEPVN